MIAFSQSSMVQLCLGFLVLQIVVNINGRCRVNGPAGVLTAACMHTCTVWIGDGSSVGLVWTFVLGESDHAPQAS
jgi:hypothetical protein